MRYSKIELHKAVNISDYYGYLYDKNVLDEVDIGDIVRISILVNDHCYESWSHDSPYVSIIKIIEVDDDINFIGEISYHNREKTDMYPLNTGERITFCLENIIEIPICFQIIETDKFSKYITDEKIPITGPLYTVEYDKDSSSSDTESDGYNESDEDNEDDESDEDNEGKKEVLNKEFDESFTSNKTLAYNTEESDESYVTDSS